jgi:hypothetical protein
MLVNFFWPASDDSLRVIANPRPRQTGGLVHLGVDWLNRIPIIWTVTVFIALVGLIYYYGFQRNKPFTPVIPPEEEVLPEGVGA